MFKKRLFDALWEKIFVRGCRCANADLTDFFVFYPLNPLNPRTKKKKTLQRFLQNLTIVFGFNPF